MKKGIILVTDGYERVVHRILVISCIVLTVSGSGMMFESFKILGTLVGGLRNLKLIHNFSGLIFAAGLILAIRVWWKESGGFVFPEDLEWFKEAGGYLRHAVKVPQTGK